MPTREETRNAASSLERMARRVILILTRSKRMCLRWPSPSVFQYYFISHSLSFLGSLDAVSDDEKREKLGEVGE